MVAVMLAGAGLGAILLLVLVRINARNMAVRAEKLLALVGMCAVPGVWLLAGVVFSLYSMQQVDFCLSCHTMDKYGESLHTSAGDSLAAGHYQNNRIPKHEACYECHADHTPVTGLIKTKLNGLKEAYIQYVEGPPETIHMKKPFPNTNCLMCHDEAANFVAAHGDDLAAIRSGESRCMECHEPGHKFKQEDKPQAEAGGAEHE